MRYALLDRCHYLRGFLGVLCFKVIPLLLVISPDDKLYNCQQTKCSVGLDQKGLWYTLKWEGCRLDSLQPTTLLKCTIVVLLLLSVTILPFEDGMM